MARYIRLAKLHLDWSPPFWSANIASSNWIVACAVGQKKKKKKLADQKLPKSMRIDKEILEALKIYSSEKSLNPQWTLLLFLKFCRYLYNSVYFISQHLKRGVRVMKVWRVTDCAVCIPDYQSQIQNYAAHSSKKCSLGCRSIGGFFFQINFIIYSFELSVFKISMFAI